MLLGYRPSCISCVPHVSWTSQAEESPSLGGQTGEALGRTTLSLWPWLSKARAWELLLFSSQCSANSAKRRHSF